MPAGPIGPTWKSGSWSDTCWTKNTWAQTITVQTANTGAGRPPFVQQLPLPPAIAALVRWELPAFISSTTASIIAPDVMASVHLLIAKSLPEFKGTAAVKAPDFEAWLSTDLGEPELHSSFKALKPKKKS